MVVFLRGKQPLRVRQQKKNSAENSNNELKTFGQSRSGPQQELIGWRGHSLATERARDQIALDCVGSSCKHQQVDGEVP